MVRYRAEWRNSINESIMQAACGNVDLLDGITSTHIYPSKLELPIVYQMAAPLDSRGNTKITDRNGLPVDLWLISANAAPVLRSHAQVLSAGDWQLINCRKRTSERDSAIALQVCLRFALSSLVHWKHSPAAWRFGRTAFGKPFIEHGPNIYFSLTHSGTLSAIALSRACSVGIDVETAAPDLCVDLMEDYLSPAERNFVRHLPRGLREREFLRLWTLKEAFAKSTGLGLSMNLSEIDVSSVAAGRASACVVCGQQSILLTSHIRNLGSTGDGWLSLAANVSGRPSSICLSIYFVEPRSLEGQ